MFRQSAKRIALALVILACALGALAQAPPVTLRTTDGRSFDLARSRDKIIVLLFNATWVPMADRELPAYQKLADRYAGRDVDFYWVSTNSANEKEKNSISDAELRAFARNMGLRLPVLRDPDRGAFHAFNLDLLPAIVIIDREGRVCLKVLGFDPEGAEYYDPEKMESYTTRAYDEVIRCLNQLLK